MRRIALFLLLLLFVPSFIHATVLLPIEFRELVTGAPIIVHGEVVDVRSEWVDGRRAVETFVTVEAAEYLKGKLGEQVTFKVPGGRVGRYRTVFVGAPSFEKGDEVVLFLKAEGPSFPFIIGLSQGVFRVVTDPGTGRRLVTPPALIGTGVEPARVVRGDPGRKPVPIDAFRETVREVLSEGAKDEAPVRPGAVPRVRHRAGAAR